MSRPRCANWKPCSRHRGNISCHGPFLLRIVTGQFLCRTSTFFVVYCLRFFAFVASPVGSRPILLASDNNSCDFLIWILWSC